MTPLIPHACPHIWCGICRHNKAHGGVEGVDWFPGNLERPGKRGASAAQSAAPLPCPHRGADTGRRYRCGSCSGAVELKVLACSVHGACTVAKPAAGVACCATCPDRPPS